MNGLVVEDFVFGAQEYVTEEARDKLRVTYWRRWKKMECFWLLWGTAPQSSDPFLNHPIWPDSERTISTTVSSVGSRCYEIGENDELNTRKRYRYDLALLDGDDDKQDTRHSRTPSLNPRLLDPITRTELTSLIITLYTCPYGRFRKG